MYNIKFLFFSKGEKYYDGERHLGNFKGEYLWGFNMAPKLRFNPKLVYELISYPYTHIIAGINGSLPLFLSFVISKIRAKKFILWSGLWQHPTTLFHRISFPFVKFIYKHSDAIITYGSHITDYLSGMGIDRNKIFEAWQTVHNNKFDTKITEDVISGLRTKYKLRKKVVLFVGRLEKVKGLEYLIDAFAQSNRKDVSLVIIGKGSLRDNLQKKAQLLIDRHIIFIDYVSNEELVRYYALADIFISPSITTRDFKEPWGLTANEAMNQALPVIVSDAFGAGAGGLIQNGVNGFIVPERDSAVLKEKIDYLLANDSIRKKMGENAKKEIARWTYERMAEGFIKAINYVEQKTYE